VFFGLDRSIIRKNILTPLMQNMSMRKLWALLAVLSSPLGTAHAEDLMTIYGLAQQNDPEFKRSGFNQQASQEIKSQSIAQMLPNVSFNATSNRTRFESTSFLGTTLQEFWDHSLGINLKQPIFHWDHWIQLDQADNQIAQADAELQAKHQGLMTRTVEAYFNILAAQDNLEFAGAEKRAIEKQLEQAQQRFDVGVIAITDVYEAQAAFDRAQANIIEAQNLLDNSKEALREIIGENISDFKTLGNDIPLSPPTPEDISAWAETAEASNFNIVSQINQAEYIRKQIDIQQAKHLPTLDVVALYRQQDNGNRYGFVGNTESIGLEFNLPLFEGGGTVSRTRKAEYDYQMAKEDLTKVKRNVNRLVKDAFRGVVASINRVRALDATKQSAKMALEAAEAGFEVGTRTMIDVLQIQRNLYKAQSDYARSRYDYLINGIKLKEAAGSLNEVDIQAINQYLQP